MSSSVGMKSVILALLIELGYGIHAIAARIGDTSEEVNRTYAHPYPNKDHIIAQDLNKYKDGMVKHEKSIEKNSEYDENELIEKIENINNKNTN